MPTHMTPVADRLCILGRWVVAMESLALSGLALCMGSSSSWWSEMPGEGSPDAALEGALGALLDEDDAPGSLVGGTAATELAVPSPLPSVFVGIGVFLVGLDGIVMWRVGDVVWFTTVRSSGYSEDWSEAKRQSTTRAHCGRPPSRLKVENPVPTRCGRQRSMMTHAGDCGGVETLQLALSAAASTVYSCSMMLPRTDLSGRSSTKAGAPGPGTAPGRETRGMLTRRMSRLFA